jgi:hypothetical protein
MKLAIWMLAETELCKNSNGTNFADVELWFGGSRWIFRMILLCFDCYEWEIHANMQFIVQFKLNLLKHMKM